MMELLAPAGSMQALKAAVKSGADAVYIGGKKFSARRSAENFSLEEIEEAVKYCHLHKVSLHVAANILIKPNETDEFIEYMGFLNEAGVDAVIIQDIGMAKAVRKIYPDLPLHASTQMTAASLCAVKYLENAGFSRVVLARELSREQIKYICANSSVETEVFVHGAICMCYSGQCLMSSVIGGRSGNRGMCAQPCRLPYKLEKDGKKLKEGYLLSPKDMSLIDYIKELSECGVDSLKIEGRLKKPEYAAAVTSVYKKYTDSFAKVTQEDRKRLLNAFSRSGFTDGYFTSKLGGNMMSYSMPGNTSEVDSALLKNLTEKKFPVEIECKMCEGEKLYIKITDSRGNKGEAQSENTVQKALNKPIDKDRLEEQLSKLGESVFFAQNVQIIMDKEVNIPIKEINSTRRKAVAGLERKILERKKRRVLKKEEIFLQKRDKRLILTAQVSNKEQLEACLKEGIKVIYIPKNMMPYVKDAQAEFAVILPGVCDSDVFENIPKNFGILVSNIAQEVIFKGYKKYADTRLNIFNSYSAEVFSEYESAALSPELNLKEISEIDANVPLELIVYGKIPLMIMKNCPVRAVTGSCRKNGGYILKDRKNEKFQLVCDENCHAVLLNSKRIYMADKMADIKKTGAERLRLIFTDENYTQTEKIIEEYKMAIEGKRINTPEENTFTRGHFYRGVL